MKKKLGSHLVNVVASLGTVVGVACGSYSAGGGDNLTSGGSSSSTSSSPSSGGDTGSGSACSSSVSTDGAPCDILKSAGNDCVAAHSTVRALYAAYAGPLYQVCKGTAVAGPGSCQGMTQDISAVGGYADAASQDAFCSGATCTITKIYDQSGNGNDLEPGPAGGQKKTPDLPVRADSLPLTISGHAAYGVLIKPNYGYRRLVGNKTATGDAAETIYMVTSSKTWNNGCCFDYGNAETDAHDDGNGTMEAVYLGGGVVWGTGSPGGHANGPWVMADLENGLYAGWENNQDQNISTNTPMTFDWVTAIVVGDVAAKNNGKGRFAIYAGDATSGSLVTKYDGIRPSKGGYVPMQLQGSIILGTGGDNSAGDTGQWYEGVMATGAACTDTLAALQANIVAAGYGK